MKKLFAGLVALSFVFVSSSTVGAATSSVGDPGKSWIIPNDAERGMHVQEFIDSFPGESVSYLLDNKLQEDPYVDPTCGSVDDSRCNSASLQYSALLPVCGTLSMVYCIEEFGVVTSSGESSKGQFSRYFPNQALNKFDANEKLKLPYGGTGSIFQLPSAPHDGGNSYYVSVLTEGGVSKDSGANLNRLNIRIYPVKLEAGYSAIQEVDAGVSRSNGVDGSPAGLWHFVGFGFSGSSFCVAGSAKEKLCAQRYAFPADMKFYVKLRLQNRPAGWMHGRIYSPDVVFNEDKGFYTFSIAAFPVAVPVVYKMYKYPEMPQGLKDSYDFKTGMYKPELALYTSAELAKPRGCGRSACTEDPLTRNVMILPSPSSKFGMDQLKLWLPFVEDKSTALLGTWSLRTLEGNETQGASKCFTNGDKGITGIVTTNATQYSAGPPAFNSTDGTLGYSVGAPHFTPTKETFLGSYDLIMRSDVARCVYGFSAAPIKASLTVVNDQGEQKVATEILGEKNGWLYLSAKGFTFSSPSILVKITQEPAAKASTLLPSSVAAVTPAPMAVTAAPKVSVSILAQPVPIAGEKCAKLSDIRVLGYSEVGTDLKPVFLLCGGDLRLSRDKTAPDPTPDQVKELEKARQVWITASSKPVAKQVLKSITCVKGKTVKTVKGVNPKCPTGYKRK